MYILQSLHWHLCGFYFSILWQRNCSVAQSLLSKGTKFQILCPRYDNISVPCNAVFILYEQKLTSWRILYRTLASLNNSHIVFGAMRCLTLYISRACSWMFRWWIVKELSFEEACRKKRDCHYELNVAFFLKVYLFCCPIFDYGTFKLRGNMPTEKKKRHSL